MSTYAKLCCSKKSSTWCPVVLLIYFIINIRVEAEIATPFERALDGLVGGVVLLFLLYVGARFFGILKPADKEDLLGCCEDGKGGEGNQCDDPNSR